LLLLVARLRPISSVSHAGRRRPCGVFSGKEWEGQIDPLVKNVILASD
jgi:hypothetical protein